jgi:hypothetical protein
MFTFATLFLHRTRIRDPRSGIRDEQILGSGSAIKHPGSATLLLILNKVRYCAKKKSASILRSEEKKSTRSHFTLDLIPVLYAQEECTIAASMLE